jgi:hypothetical protein
MSKKIHLVKRAVPKATYSSELPLAGGCVYVTGMGMKGKETFKIFCHKICQEGSQYCPKHVLYVEDEGKEVGRRYLARKAKREAREAELAALALSPLKADNPLFGDDVATRGYSK